MKYALRLSVHMLMGGMLFSVLLGRLSLTGFLFGAALGFVPVSYTHLDVYKRQG